MPKLKSTQYTLEGETILDSRIQTSLSIIQSALERSHFKPLIVNFSGGKDSHVLLDLVQKCTDRFVCVYMVSGIDFPECKDFVQSICEKRKIKLLVSHPQDYSTKKFPQNGFFERLAVYKSFPTVRTTWCSIYLKIRPARRMLRRHFGGKVLLFKLNGVRRNESSRRMKIYREVAKHGYIKPDPEHRPCYMVFPILDWSNQNVEDYLEREKLHVPPNPLYEKYGISGCYYCPFYSTDKYQSMMSHNRTLYDQFIEWEERLKKPSVLGRVWLRDIKQSLMSIDAETTRACC